VTKPSNHKIARITAIVQSTSIVLSLVRLRIVELGPRVLRSGLARFVEGTFGRVRDIVNEILGVIESFARAPHGRFAARNSFVNAALRGVAKTLARVFSGLRREHNTKGSAGA
jgi:hypothetical protein